MNAAYGGYTTAIFIENVSHTGTAANVTITYYNQDGSVAGTGDTTPVGGLPFWAEWTVRQNNGHSFAAGAAGWASVASDQEVAVFVNEFAPGASTDGSSYTSIQPGGVATLFAPTIVNNAYGGYTTGIGLSNVANAATVAAITYRNSAGTVVKTQTSSLPAHGYVGLFSGDATLALPDGFTGTATITAVTGMIAAVVNETGPGGQFSSYDAISSGASNLFAAAALNHAYGGYTTGMAVQNTTAAPGTVTVDYYDGAGTKAATVSKAIPANGFLGIYQASLMDGPPASSSGYTAVIQSTQPIAAVVNETAPGGTQLTAYNAEPNGSGYLNLALVENAGTDGWSTGVGLMNITSTSISFNATYFNADTGAFIKATSLMLAPHAFMGLYTPADLPAGSRATLWLSSTTAGLAAICNEQGTSSLMSYNGQ
jgi:hypothetical protein